MKDLEDEIRRAYLLDDARLGNAAEVLTSLLVQFLKPKWRSVAASGVHGEELSPILRNWATQERDVVAPEV